MPEKHDMQLAAALKIIRNLLDGAKGSEQEALAFLETPDLPKPRRFFLQVGKAEHNMPGFAAYLYPTISEAPEGQIPVGQVLINLDCILWSCVDSPESHWDEIAAESVGHECIHALQELLGQRMEEYHVQESIEAARAQGQSGYCPADPEAWQDSLDTTMETANPGSVVVFVDQTHPEATLVLQKLDDTISESTGEPEMTGEWAVLSDVGEINLDITTTIDGETTLLYFSNRDDKEDDHGSGT